MSKFVDTTYLLGLTREHGGIDTYSLRESVETSSLRLSAHEGPQDLRALAGFDP